MVLRWLHVHRGALGAVPLVAGVGELCAQEVRGLIDLLFYLLLD